MTMIFFLSLRHFSTPTVSLFLITIIARLLSSNWAIQYNIPINNWGQPNLCVWNVKYYDILGNGG